MEVKYRTLVFNWEKVDVFKRTMDILMSRDINFAAEYNRDGVHIISFGCADNFYERLINNSDFKGTNYCN